MAILSKGMKLSHSDTSEGVFTDITGLKSVPALGASKEKVDVTTLADGNYKYINGIKDFGDLEFKFLYSNSGTESNYRICRGLEEAGKVVEWKVSFPDGTSFEFSGEPSTTIDGQSVNSAITFTLNITLNSDITVSNPV